MRTDAQILYDELRDAVDLLVEAASADQPQFGANLLHLARLLFEPPLDVVTAQVLAAPFASTIDIEAKVGKGFLEFHRRSLETIEANLQILRVSEREQGIHTTALSVVRELLSDAAGLKVIHPPV